MEKYCSSSSIEIPTPTTLSKSEQNEFGLKNGHTMATEKNVMDSFLPWYVPIGKKGGSSILV